MLDSDRELESATAKVRILDHADLLGTLSDSELARRLSVPRTTVTEVRTTLGIPAAPWEARLTLRQVMRLGSVPDSEIAQEVGCSVQTIGRWRAALGIASWRSGRGGKRG